MTFAARLAVLQFPALAIPASSGSPAGNFHAWESTGRADFALGLQGVTQATSAAFGVPVYSTWLPDVTLITSTSQFGANWWVMANGLSGGSFDTGAGSNASGVWGRVGDGGGLWLVTGGGVPRTFTVWFSKDGGLTVETTNALVRTHP